MGPDSVPSEVTRDWNQDPSLKLDESEIIYPGEIRECIESGTGDVAMGCRARQIFVIPTVLEDWMEAFSRRCDCHLSAGLAAVRK